MAKTRIEDQICTKITETIKSAGLGDPDITVNSRGNGHYFTQTITVMFIKPYGHEVLDLSGMSSDDLLDKMSWRASKSDKIDTDYTVIAQIKQELRKRLSVL